MNLTVFGATGRTGRPLVARALDRGHAVTAFVRDPAKLPAALRDRDGLAVVTGDAYTGEGVEEAVAGADAVVSVLGQTSDGPDDLLTVAGGHVLDAMADHGVERFVTLVGAGVTVEGDRQSLAGRVIGTALKLVAGEVLADAADHVELVRAAPVDWTVVRAPRLSEAAPAGDYRTGPDVTPGAAAVPRADVATFVLDCVEEDRFVGELPKIAR